MQREVNCGECGVVFLAFSGAAIYCGTCRIARRERWDSEHKEARKAIAAAYANRHNKGDRRRKPRVQACDAVRRILYCPACDRKTVHLNIFVASHGTPSRWQCSGAGCKRSRAIGAEELRMLASPQVAVETWDLR